MEVRGRQVETPPVDVRALPRQTVGQGAHDAAVDHPVPEVAIEVPRPRPLQVLLLHELAHAQLLAVQGDLAAVRQEDAIGVGAVHRRLDDLAHGARRADQVAPGVPHLGPGHDVGPHGEDPFGEGGIGIGHGWSLSPTLTAPTPEYATNSGAYID